MKCTTQLSRTVSLAKTANTWCKDTVHSGEDLSQKSHAPSSLSICLQAERPLSDQALLVHEARLMFTGSAHQSLCLCKRRHHSCSLEPRGRTPVQVACPLWCPTIQHAFTAEGSTARWYLSTCTRRLRESSTPPSEYH